jgi:hypothetical protein
MAQLKSAGMWPTNTRGPKKRLRNGAAKFACEDRMGMYERESKPPINGPIIEIYEIIVRINLVCE